MGAGAAARTGAMPHDPDRRNFDWYVDRAVQVVVFLCGISAIIFIIGIIYINPILRPQPGLEAGYWEGCLSIPGMRGYVERPQHLIVDYQDVAGDARTLEVRGFLATVFQHEFDHLDGTLYIDRLRDTRKLAFDDEYTQFIKEEN